MSSYIRWPIYSGGGGGSGQVVTLYNTVADLPLSATDGDLAEVLGTYGLYVYKASVFTWEHIAGPEVYSVTLTYYVDRALGSDTTGTGSYTQPFQTFAAALTHVTGLASETNPVVIQLREGAFTGVNCALPPFVTINGSGKTTTSLRLTGTLSAGSSWSTPPSGAYNSATISNLTLSCSAFLISVTHTVSNLLNIENVFYSLFAAETIELRGFTKGFISNCYIEAPIRYTGCKLDSFSNAYQDDMVASNSTAGGTHTGDANMIFTGDYFGTEPLVESLSGAPDYTTTAHFAGCSLASGTSLTITGINSLCTFDASMGTPSITNSATATRSALTGNLQTSVTGYSSNTALTNNDFSFIAYLSAGPVITLPDPTSYTNGVFEFNVPSNDTVYSQITTPVGLIGGISATIRLYPGDSIRIITCATVGYSILSYNLSYRSIRVQKTSLTSAQIKGMFATPVTVLAAPGANKFYSIINYTFYYHYGTVQYASGGNLQLKQGGAVSGIGTAASFLTLPTVDQITVPITNAVAANAAASVFTNSAVTVTNITGAFTTGDGTLDVYVYYTITDLTM